MCLQHYDQIFYDFFPSPWKCDGKNVIKNEMQPFFLTKNIINTLWKVVEGVDRKHWPTMMNLFSKAFAVSRD